ncbi:3-methyl-2-oxobutanoate dehydrogenase subunit VorB [Desulfofundulus thermosubterraneus]|uniref:2-oxoglutarate ferredoxin oxidoreductase subunit alpha n=1 Tax=Desulfofundulus thermosubterraneus DSM 16057 TaxID=1121432 RepID=A0A1M6I7F4_9FIRM|nr:3-methyl-2-oxobutanoate dehydrogenase subunit VorB [Desulfofundulus thermosubterraneus]SHJ30326.1 2-oxoglutarate ferredoxin oxidoreductase subunit alpha [Desulfofundulus thermosubterraneus DSM 16057]
MAKILMKGNEAIGEGAVRAGCRYFFGYPITPQSELPHYLAKRLPEVGGVYLQSESETGAINMVYGAAGAGARVMTSSSGPGISLMQEGISYLAGAELPCVIVNMIRGGPGLGNIAPAQSDYFQATKGGGHGDYRVIVLAPASVQEIIDLMRVAFDLADRYRNPVMVAGDGILGQMMEPVELGEEEEIQIPPRPWAATGRMGGEKKLINSLYIVPEELEQHNLKLARKYALITEREQRWEEYRLGGAKLVLVAFGTAARICKAVVDRCREEGLAVGLIRPITLWPFPQKAFEPVIEEAERFLVVEMNLGQMVEDVRLTVNGRRPVHFYGRCGGMLPVAADVVREVKKLYGGEGQ